MSVRNDWDVMKSLHGHAANSKAPQQTVNRVFVACPVCGKRAAKYPAEGRISCGICGNLKLLNR